MNNRRFLPLIGIATILTMLAFILSACAGGLPSVSGPAAPIASGPTSQSTTAPTPIASAPTSMAKPAPALVADGDCSNPLLPVVAGASWNYSLTGDATNMTITHTIPTVSAAGFTDQDVFNAAGADSVTQTGEWQCSQGALTDLTPWSASSEGSDVKNTFKATAMVGPTLPAAAAAGNSWKQTYAVAVTSTENSVTVQVNENVSENCNIIGMESVTVTAGTFNATHIKCQTSISTTMTTQGQSAPIVTNFQEDKWYASHVGLVKEDDQSNVGQNTASSSVLELTAYSIP